MKIIIISLIFLSLFITSFILHDDKTMVKNNFRLAEEQESLMLEKIGNSELNPRSINKDGSLKLVELHDWTSGFFPGCLWYLYEYTNDNKWKNSAEFFTYNVEKEQFNGGTHDES